MKELTIQDFFTQATSSPLRLLLAGPVAVGKSWAAEQLAKLNPGLLNLEHDRLKKKKTPCLDPCSKSFFDPIACFGELIPKDGDVICDLGGDSVFYNGANNKLRRTSMIKFKHDFFLTIAVLEASQEVVELRFRKSRGPNPFDDFSQLWKDWLENQKPHWLRIADIWVDAT